MKRISISAAVCLLAGCSEGPSESEARDALARFYEQQAARRPTFDPLNVGKCQAAEGSPGYACAAQGQAAFNPGGRVQRELLTGTFVFDRVGGRWTIVGMR